MPPRAPPGLLALFHASLGGMTAATITVELLRSYDKPGPRYTSYPTAVEFHEGFDEGSYREHLTLAAAEPG